MIKTNAYLIQTNEGFVVKRIGNRTSLPVDSDIPSKVLEENKIEKCGLVEERDVAETFLFYSEIPSVPEFEGKETVSQEDLFNEPFLPGDLLYIRQILDGKRDINMFVVYNSEGRMMTAFDRRKIPFFKAFFSHLHTVNRHRRLVRKNCFKVGLYYQGLVHDLSKYSPAEFWVGVKYYQGLRSPNVAERMTEGYSRAWMHHKGRNKHHHEYWTDYSIETGNILEFMEMPKRYFVESLMDRIAACKVYRGKTCNDSAALDYLLTRDSEKYMNKNNREEMIRLLTMLSEKGEKEFFRYLKYEYLKH